MSIDLHVVTKKGKKERHRINYGTLFKNCIERNKLNIVILNNIKSHGIWISIFFFRPKPQNCGKQKTTTTSTNPVATVWLRISHRCISMAMSTKAG